MIKTLTAELDSEEQNVGGIGRVLLDVTTQSAAPKEACRRAALT
jgi:hypothetical protein